MLSSIGLSLCIQGTLEIENIYSIKQRFIPVHTGNMPCNFGGTRNNRGLSLCIQGTCRIKWSKLRLHRFIPVHTGNMRYGNVSIFTTTVYPCAYREHFQFAFLHKIPNGLSLCIQGTSGYQTGFCFEWRFIPVHTGNIFRAWQLQLRVAVYPCAYREHFNFSDMFNLVHGLSLCIQGTYQL